MRHGSLFSGIGGFDLSAEWMGWENVFHCEWNEFGQKVLKHYWPNAESFGDITKTNFSKYYGTVDVISGGFPCQPYSAAGKRLGKEDERHLFPEMLRAIREIAPRWVVGENVRGLTNWNGGLVFDEVCTDLENLGYQVAPYIIPAVAVNAPHKRERIFFIASHCTPSKKSNTQHSDSIGQEWGLHSTNNDEAIQNKVSRRDARRYGAQTWDNFPSQSPLCSGDDGFPSRLDGITFSKWRNESIKAYGNAVCPNVVFEIFKSIQAYENLL